MKRLLPLIVLLAGCTTFEATTPEGAVIRGTKFGLFDTKIEGVTYRGGPTTRPTEFELQKYGSSEKMSQLLAEAFRAGFEAGKTAAKAAVVP